LSADSAVVDQATGQVINALLVTSPEKIKLDSKKEWR
jgi:hypothetical protein